MPKLIVLLCFLVALSLGISLVGNSSIPVSNEKVTLEKLEQNFARKQALLGIHTGSEVPADETQEVDPLVAGKELYTANCLSCHGDSGNGAEGGAQLPKLSGQFDWYIVIQLKAYNSGERIAPSGGHKMESLSKDDMKAVGAYIQSL